MFEAAAKQIQAAVYDLTKVESLGGWKSEHWSTIRQRCKDVIVLLESQGQAVVAARVEREYGQLRNVLRTDCAHDSVRNCRRHLRDAADELLSTLAALTRFHSHLFDEDPNGKQGTLNGNAAQPDESARRKGRAIEANLRLQHFLNDHTSEYERLAPLIVSGDHVALAEFRETFGPKSIAQRWVVEDGERPHSPNVNRWSTAIKVSSLYQDAIKPLFAKPPETPLGPIETNCEGKDWTKLLN